MQKMMILLEILTLKNISAKPCHVMTQSLHESKIELWSTCRSEKLNLINVFIHNEFREKYKVSHLYVIDYMI